MKIIYILIFFQFLVLNINAQIKPIFVSNKWYFNQFDDTLFFSQKHIRANKVKYVREYRTDKEYADSIQLMGEYFFDTLGILIKTKTYDIHGSFSISEYKIASNGKIAEVWVVGHSGVLTKSIENIYFNDSLIKQTSYYGQNYSKSVEYTYRTDGLLLSTQYFGPKNIKGSNIIYVYDSLNHIISEITKDANDSIICSYVYRYDKLGRKYFTKYKENNYSYTETIDYSKSTSNSTIQMIYFNNKLDEIIIKTVNKQGLIIKLITDKRVSIKKKRRIFTNIFCGYSGPSRYQKTTFKYNSRGYLICKKIYSSPHKTIKRIKFTVDNKGNLINKAIFHNFKKDSEWGYSYNYYR